MNTTRRLLNATALTIAATCAGAAGATTVSFEGWNVAGTRPVINIVQPAAAPDYVHAGEFRIRIDGNPDTSFCIELTQNIGLGQTYSNYTLQDAGLRFGALQLDRLSRLFEHHLDASRANTANSAAFQVAVWEIAYDGANGLNLTGGNFRIGGSQSGPGATAALWLANLDSQSAGGWAFKVLTSPTHQDQLIASRVPLPATALLLAGGLAVLAARRRRSAG